MFDLREVKTTRKNRNEDENWDEGEAQIEEPELEEEELLNRCRKAGSKDEFSKAMDTLVESVRRENNLSLVAKESIVRNVLLEIPYRLSKNKIDQIFDGCGILTTMSAVANLVKELSTGLVLPSSGTNDSTGNQFATDSSSDQSALARVPLQIPSVLQACFATIYRMLLVVPTSLEGPSSPSMSISAPLSMPIVAPLFEELQAENVTSFVQMILLFPQIIANACHKWKLNPPPWATANQYLPKLVATAFVAATKETSSEQTNNSGKPNHSSPQIIAMDTTPKSSANDDRDNKGQNTCCLYCSTLLKNMLGTLKGHHVAKGLKHQHPCGKELVQILMPNSPGDNDGDSDDDDDDDSSNYEIRLGGNYMDAILTTREFASLVVSILQLNVASSPNDDSSVNTTATPPAMQSCLDVLKASTRDHREALVQAVALSGKFDPRIGPIFVRLLHSADYLYPHLCEIAEHWSLWTFVHQMERETTQSYVTNLLLEGLKLLIQEEDGEKKNYRDPSGDALTSSLLQGVTHRLDSAFPPIRRDGMMVGQLLAKRIGEDLQFEELEEFRKEVGSEVGANDTKAAPTSKAQSDKGHNIDPDTVYKSNEEETDDNGDAAKGRDDASDIIDDQSVTWDEDLVPYDLDDPEEDLVETPRPYHLLEALELIRTVESSEHAYSNHETGLKYLPEMIESRPDDLHDVAVSLLLSLLKMENKFNIETFLEMRQKAITCLVIQEPRLIGETMIEELFKDSGLSDRLNILVALQDAAYYLSGSECLVNQKAKPSQRQLQTSGSTIGCKELNSLELKRQEQLTRIQEKTRRKRSRPTSPVVVQNQFTAIAPMWFYSMIQKFIETRENESLWRDATGSHFLASFFRALAAIVEFSGMHSAQVLGKDLFDLVWSFRDADVAEVRVSVLVATATSFAMIPLDRLLALFMDHDIHVISLALHAIAEDDPDSGCRTIAQTIRQSLNEVSNRSVILN